MATWEAFGLRKAPAFQRDSLPHLVAKDVIPSNVAALRKSRRRIGLTEITDRMRSVKSRQIRA